MATRLRIRLSNTPTLSTLTSHEHRAQALAGHLVD